MSGKDQKSLSTRVDNLRERLERRRKQHKGRLPERLWAAAVELARECGVNPISRSLRLDYYCLKRRLEAFRGNADPKKIEPNPAFVEIELPSVQESAHCIVKMEDRSGACLTVQVPASCVGELAGVARALWTPRP
jgi:hypothetical protein